MTRSLRVGDRVRVRTLEEILATLDQDGCLDALPFMPEMVHSCGREFTVLKRLDRVKDMVDRTGLRRMLGAVILDGDRCDGSRHGRCQALCQSIWKEAWLTRITSASRPSRMAVGTGSPATMPGCTEADLLRFCKVSCDGGEERFRCQQTEMKRASSYLAWWDPRQYWRDWWSGTMRTRVMMGAALLWGFRWFLRHVGGGRILVPAYNRIQRLRGGEVYPYGGGVLQKTPVQKLDLRPGEWVQVKSFDDIRATLSLNNRNRGLWFDAEMVKYCNGVYRVLCRVERIIDPKSGRLVNLTNDCIILDGVTTRGEHHGNCHNEYQFWREIWLRRCGEHVATVIARAPVPASRPIEHR
jgi:hypothetical protein